jgi:hypothetical protein
VLVLNHSLYIVVTETPFKLPFQFFILLLLNA